MKQLLTVCAAPASATPEEVRPRERLDMTPQDRVALGTPYAQCLAEHGVDKKSAPQPKEVIEKAEKACGSKSRCRRGRTTPAIRNPTTSPTALCNACAAREFATSRCTANRDRNLSAFRVVAQQRPAVDHARFAAHKGV